jgi:zinc transport system substrate-binding protein
MDKVSSVQELIERTKEWGLSYIFIIEGSDGKVAEVVAGETGAQVLTLHSMQVVSDYENTTYLAVMKQNLENLKKALQ